MKKPTDVLIRLHGVNPPAELGIETITRDDAFLKEVHKKEGILPGKKVFETILPKDRPWRMVRVEGDLSAAGYELIGINVEYRPDLKNGGTKAVLSLNYSTHPGRNASERQPRPVTPSQKEWVAKSLAKSSYRLAQGYLNPRTDGTSQLAIDCNQATETQPGHGHLPIPSLLGTTQNSSKTVSAV